MDKLRVELNRSGVRELLKSPEMAALLQEQTDAIAGRCGDGYGTDTALMETRMIASVFTDTKEAYRDNLDNNTILRALQ